MLPDAHRMRRRAEFSSAVRSGRRAGGALLVVHVGSEAATASDGSARVGFVVSRAVGKAVVRNRVRRRLRHLMRDRLHRVPEGTLVVVRARRAAAVAGFGDLAVDLDRTLQRALGRRRHRQPETRR